MNRGLVVAVAVLFALSCTGGGSSDGGSGGGGGGGPVPARIDVASGDEQNASPGSAVALAPTVAVVDAGGSPVPGITVAFEVSTGGGTVLDRTAVTGANGRASCGAWTLGTGRGLNSLRARVAGLAPATFVAAGVASSTSLTARVNAPLGGALWPGPTNSGLVIVQAQSIYTVVSASAVARSLVADVTASFPLGPGTYSCTRSSQCPAWVASPNLDAFPWGRAVMFVTATDALGNFADDAVFFAVDRHPVVHVSAPTEGALARPGIRIDATCTDDGPGGCDSLVATFYGNEVARGTTTIATTVDLSRFDGISATLRVTGVDAAGQPTSVSRQIFVESSPALRTVATVPGTVRDFGGSRVLYADTSVSPPALRIRDLATGSDTNVDAGATIGLDPSPGFLTPGGALYVLLEQAPGTSAYSASLYEWEGGSRTQLARLLWAESLPATGDFAAYVADDALLGPTLTCRDLRARTSVVLASPYGGFGFAVTGTGYVAYDTAATDSGFNEIFLWHAGTTERLTHDGSASVLNAHPVTDGAQTVYAKRSSATVQDTWQIVVNDGTGDVVLAPDLPTRPAPIADFAIESGWVAFTRPDAFGVKQVWRRPPSGADALPITVFSAGTLIDAVDGSGTVALVSGSSRYRAAVGSLPVRVGSRLGRVVLRDGRLLVILGGSVLDMGP